MRAAVFTEDEAKSLRVIIRKQKQALSKSMRDPALKKKWEILRRKFDLIDKAEKKLRKGNSGGISGNRRYCSEALGFEEGTVQPGA